MLDRESTFADKKIVELLQEKFIPVAIDQWYTRRQQDTEGEFYRKIASQGPRGDFQKTTQGLYVADPAGKLIAYNNNRGPERIRGLLEQAIADYDAPAAKPIARETVDPKYHPIRPEGSIVVRVSARVLDGFEPPRDGFDRIFQNAVSRDNLWVTEEEQRDLLNERFPLALARRIARFHLVDNTRGEPPIWRLDEIRKLDLSISDGRVTGDVELKTTDNSRGYAAKVSGLVSGASGRVSELKLYVEGDFWGAGPFTRDPPKGTFPLAIAFQIADGNDTADAIAPHASRGWLEGYLNPER